MSQPAARVNDMHICPMITPAVVPVPHVGGPILPPGAITVLIGSMPAARIGDLCVCVGPPDAIITGAFNVLIMGSPAARIGDMTAHGGAIAVGLPTVLIGMAGISVPALILGGLGAVVARMLSAIRTMVRNATAEPAPGAALQAAVDGVNPLGGTVNCGHIIDAVIARLRGTDPNATAPLEGDGSFTEIETRLNAPMTWGSSFDDAYAAVERGGPGTTAVVGIGYSGGTGSHVVILANDGGTVGIVEGQNWGPDNPPEVITDVDRANERYNGDGGSNIGWGIVP